MSQSGNSLKDQNRLPLITVGLANALVLYALSQAHQFELSGMAALLTNWVGLMPAGAAFAITSIITELFDATAKARLVFWKWADPLPGSRAFSKYAERDPRVNVPRLRKKIGTIPKSTRDQNATWYGLYLALQNDERVLYVHQRYLFTRDYAALSAMLIVVGGIISIRVIPQTSLALTYIGSLIVQYLLVRQAAKHHGEGLVTTVLALTSNN